MKQFKTPENLTVGPVTANLLLSLRSVEAARDYAFRSYVDLFGEDLAQNEMGELDQLFDAVRVYLNRKIGDNINYWANCIEPDEI